MKCEILKLKIGEEESVDLPLSSAAKHAAAVNAFFKQHLPQHKFIAAPKIGKSVVYSVGKQTVVIDTTAEGALDMVIQALFQIQPEIKGLEYSKDAIKVTAPNNVQVTLHFPVAKLIDGIESHLSFFTSADDETNFFLSGTVLTIELPEKTTKPT